MFYMLSSGLLVNVRVQVKKTYHLGLERYFQQKLTSKLPNSGLQILCVKHICRKLSEDKLEKRISIETKEIETIAIADQRYPSTLLYENIISNIELSFND